VSVRTREGEQRNGVPLDDFVAEVVAEVGRRGAASPAAAG